MARTKFAPDRGLSVRMVITMVLLALLYVVLVVAISAFFGGFWMIGIAIGLGVLWAQWYFSDKIALSAMGAKEVTPAQEPQLHAMVDRLCALADMPKPKVAVSNSRIPNAFAAGRSPDRAVVCVTSGIRGKLTEDELEAVLAHELSHVAHRDVLVMTIASVVGVLAGFMTRALLWTGMMGGGRSRDNNAGAMILVVMLVAAVVYAVSFLLTRLLSRYRELAADRGGAILTGQPSNLASALTKITGEMGSVPEKDLREAESYNAFFFVPAITKKFDLASMFHTHPPLDKRLNQLQKISLELGQG